MGRKRHLLVDTLGLILHVVVHSAAIQDRDGAKLVLAKLLEHFGWLRCIFVDERVVFRGTPIRRDSFEKQPKNSVSVRESSHARFLCPAWRPIDSRLVVGWR